MNREIENLIQALRPADILTKNIQNVELNFAILHPRLRFYAETFPEKEVLQFIDSLAATDCLIDLGAAEGRFALYAAKKGIETWAIEPDKHNFTALQANQELNRLNNLHPLQIAVGKTSGVAKLMSGQPFPGGHQKVLRDCEGRKDLQFHFSEVQEVTLLTFTTLCQKYQIRPTALKIDIDGSELDFFQGVTELSDINQIMIELCTQDVNYVKILNILNGHGFKLHSQHSIPEEKNLYNFWFTR